MQRSGWLNRCLLTVALSAVGVTGHADAGQRLDLTFRVYEAIRTAKAGPGEAAVPVSLRPAFSARLATAGDLDAEKACLLRTFNLREASLVSETALVIGEGGQAPDRVRQPFSLGNRPFQIVLLMTEFIQPVRLFAVVLEKTGDRFETLLGETVELEGGRSTVLGLEDGAGKTFFLTLRITGPEEMMPHPTPPPPPPPPRAADEEAKIREFERGAVVIDLDLPPPQLIRIVDPVLPPGAPAPVPGDHASLSIRIDETGRVIGVRTVFSSNPAFEAAAKDAVRHWRYQPYFVDGKARQAVIPVTVRSVAR